MFFSVILILLIAIVFRKQKMAETGQQKSDEIEHLPKNKKELILGLSWYIFYFMLSYISCAYQVDIISELSNWLFLELFALPPRTACGFAKRERRFFSNPPFLL